MKQLNIETRTPEEEQEPSFPWAKLTPELVREVAARTSTNDVAVALKLLNKEAAACLNEYQVINLVQPAPNQALPVQPWPAAAFVAHWGRAAPWRALSLRQRQRLLSLAAASGDAASLDAALGQSGCSVNDDVLECAAAAGCLPALQRLLQREGGRLGVRRAAEAAARAGQLGVLQWIVQQHRPAVSDEGFRRVCRSLACAAASARQARIVEWLADEQQLVDLTAADSAEQIAEAAARSGLEGLLERVLPHVRPPRFALLTNVAVGCSLAVLQRHYESLVEGADVGQVGLGDAVSAAAVGPGADWLQKVAFLTERWQQAAVVAGGAAGAAGVAVVIKMCYSAPGPPRPPDVQRLQALRELGCSLDAELFKTAARMGHADIVAWMLEEEQQRRGGGVDVAALAVEAVRGGSMPVVQLLQERGLVVGPQHLRMLISLMTLPAVRASDFAMFLFEAVEGATPEDWAAAFKDAAAVGLSTAALRRLHERHGAAVNLSVINAMIQGGCAVEALDWALEVERAAGGAAQQQVRPENLWIIAGSRGYAAADWLRGSGLLAPPFMLGADWVVQQVVNATGSSTGLCLVALAWWRAQRRREALSQEQEARLWAVAARYAGQQVWAWF
ncbi:hypothetical protein HXX76_006853 [Chlamydomonas incerta]|uniref:Ankyrin repeat domain-containing protein n=1 Tax=Chlamydomonas incerta TaxID=51695 RepID=A0A835TCG1_CHLIN|nr:hypothetical protein HXX76_006853 [Chlamydomonas incerta]|eukprot:KAG2435651.1 hypothetical protein HXX76_006853 [Chlamydomonas incerta]